MPRRIPPGAFLWATLCLAAPAAADDAAWFEARVRPLLTERCIECHSAAKHKGGLRLDTRGGWEKGGTSGAAVVPGNPDESLLIQAVRYTDDALKMPPKGKLAPAEIAALERWVQMGAHDPRTSSKPAPAQNWLEVFQARKQW